MTVYAIGATSLIGGGSGALDAEHVNDADGNLQIHDGDPAFVCVQGDVIYHFIADADSGGVPDGEAVIKPLWESDGVSYTGDLRWIRHYVFGIGGEAFTTALKNKLEGVEALADVTDAVNVAAAGAVMSETDPVFSAWDKDYADLSNTPTLGTAAAENVGAFAPALGADDNYVTDAEKSVVGNTSGVNTGDQDLSGKENTGVASGLVTAHESAYDHSLIGTALQADGTKAMTGNLNMGTHKITGVVDPVDDQDAATKKFVMDQIENALAKAAVLGTL